MAREYRYFSRRFPWLAAVRAPALACVLALGVFAHDYPVQVAVGGVAQGGLGAPENLGGAHVGVLLEGLADCEAEVPQGDVVGYIFMMEITISIYTY